MANRRRKRRMPARNTPVIKPASCKTPWRDLVAAALPALLVQLAVVAVKAFFGVDNHMGPGPM